MQNVSNTNSPLVSTSGSHSVAGTKSTLVKAGIIQLWTPQPSAALTAHGKTPAPLTDVGTTLASRKTEPTTSALSVGNDEQQPGPLYKRNDRKETTSGVVWVLDKSIKIRGVDFEKWPPQLSLAEIEAYFESGNATVLSTICDEPTDEQAGLMALPSVEKVTDSKRPMPSLKLLLPESNDQSTWLKFFKENPRRVDEDSLVQAFGAEGARYIRSQLDQFSTGNEQVQQWKEICELVRFRATCSLPYIAKTGSPSKGRGENIIFEMMFVQKDKNASAYEKNDKAKEWQTKMHDFLKNAGIDGELASHRRYIESYRGGFVAENESGLGGAVQFFLTTNQTRQLFTLLRSFVTGQVSGSIE